LASPSQDGIRSATLKSFGRGREEPQWDGAQSYQTPATKPYGGNGGNNGEDVYCTRCEGR